MYKLHEITYEIYFRMTLIFDCMIFEIDIYFITLYAITYEKLLELFLINYHYHIQQGISSD